MNAKFFHPSRGGSVPPARIHDDTIEARQAVTLGSACCCPAKPVVQVVMPPTAARPHRTELLLCGHHYRASSQALAAAGATVTGLLGIFGSPLAALLPDLHVPASPSAETTGPRPEGGRRV
jgi:hypothetical protein